MTTELNVEVVPIAGRWVIRHIVIPAKEGGSQGVYGHVADYRWKYQAVLVARFYCRHRSNQLSPDESVELVIKDRKGQIRDKETYGYDSEETVG